MRIGNDLLGEPWTRHPVRPSHRGRGPRGAPPARPRPLCACGAVLEDTESLLDHRGWCRGDAAANRRLIAAVVAHSGEATYEALVAAARPPPRP
jgi:hypothetical protein